MVLETRFDTCAAVSESVAVLVEINPKFCVVRTLPGHGHPYPLRRLDDDISILRSHPSKTNEHISARRPADASIVRHDLLKIETLHVDHQACILIPILGGGNYTLETGPAKTLISSWMLDGGVFVHMCVPLHCLLSSFLLVDSYKRGSSPCILLLMPHIILIDVMILPTYPYPLKTLSPLCSLFRYFHARRMVLSMAS